MPITPRIIIDFAHAEKPNIEALIRHVENIQTYYNTSGTIEVMAYADGINLLLKHSPFSDALDELTDEGVIFVACQNTMKRMNLTKDELREPIHEALSGLGHIVDRQLAGWAYLKE